MDYGKYFDFKLYCAVLTALDNNLMICKATVSERSVAAELFRFRICRIAINIDFYNKTHNLQHTSLVRELYLS